LRIRLESGEEARAVRVDGQVLVVRSPRAYAPGSPISFSIETSEEERALEGRTIGSKRLEDGEFEVRMRLVNLRRADRERLLHGLR
jgi:hypothetical protein